MSNPRKWIVRVVHALASGAAALFLVVATGALLRAGGARALMLGVATLFSLLAIPAGVTSVMVGRLLHGDTNDRTLDRVGAVLVVGGLVGVVAGLRVIDRLVPLDPWIVGGAIVAILLAVAPIGILAFYAVRGFAIR